MAAVDNLRVTFFEECEDQLARMGDGLGQMARSLEATDMETIHDVFRAVHSVKGGAGAFGLTALVAFSHAFESVLDRMRGGDLRVGAPLMHTLLRAYDVLSDLIAAARDDAPPPPQAEQLLGELDLLAETGADDEGEIAFTPIALDLFAPGGAADDPVDDAPSGPPARAADFVIRLQPRADLYTVGLEPAALLRSLSKLGEMVVAADTAAITPLAGFDPGQPNLRWQITLRGIARQEDIEAVFEFVGDLAEIAITALPEDAPEATLDEPPARTDPAIAPCVPAPEAPATAAPPMTAPAQQATAHAPVPATIRVNLDRVDRLINQIGELVIMEAMLSQAIMQANLMRDDNISSSLDGIKQLATNIQESVMAIRAQPLKPVFQRMERITREAADATGKQVRLITQGEATEVDKTLIERLVDPLTHMIRNSVDHGIEAPAQRLAAGKPLEGRITLSAAHRSGRVIIEVSDDGGGINRTRVRELAEERGLIPPGVQFAPSDIDNLLFMPGFSSKEDVSALSGRGVGLDVVRREIHAIGGRVSIQSTPGQGTTFSIALPLTLAVLDGMLIGVGQETMVLPLSAIIETLRPSATREHRLGPHGRVILNRDEPVPIIDLAARFGLTGGARDENGVLILVHSDTGRKAALAVDRIHEQRQVVIKSLEDNFGDVPGISAATILGDGRIALIVDAEEVLSGVAPDASSLPLVANG